METKKYKLKKGWPGMPKFVKENDIITKQVNSIYYGFDNHVALFSKEDIENFPEFFEPIIERTPIGKTSESEVYENRVDSDVFEGDNVWYVYLDLGIDNGNMQKYYPSNLKYFLTKQAAEDYVKLQKAIKRAVAFDKLTVYRYYVSGAGECIVKVGNVCEHLSCYTALKINPYDCKLSELTQTIALLTKIKEEREGE